MNRSFWLNKFNDDIEIKIICSHFTHFRYIRIRIFFCYVGHVSFICRRYLGIIFDSHHSINFRTIWTLCHSILWSPVAMCRNYWIFWAVLEYIELLWFGLLWYIHRRITTVPQSMQIEFIMLMCSPFPFHPNAVQDYSHT